MFQKIIRKIVLILLIYVSWTLYGFNMEKILYKEWVGGKFVFPFTILITNAFVASCVVFVLRNIFQFFKPKQSQSKNENENEKEKKKGKGKEDKDQSDSKNKKEQQKDLPNSQNKNKNKNEKQKKQNETKVVSYFSEIPIKEFLFVSLIQTISYSTSISSHKYTNYPTKILVKSCKPISILVLGSLIYKRKYPVLRYLSMIGMCLGIALFSYQQKGSHSDEHNLLYSLSLLSVALFSDGIYAQHIDNLHRKYPSSSRIRSMIVINFLLVFCLMPLWLINAYERNNLLSFFKNNPQLIYLLLGSGVLSGIGQLVIYYSLQYFDSVIMSVITTSRKFITILFSIVYFKHTISRQQWASIALVFASLLIDSFSKAHVFEKLFKKQPKKEK
ncbi:solute carrier family 35 member b1 [Anaeramoeba flamelloides]|uniref:Solute carrier family 35 member b1 n=1 Tax=Anaeramoeba flamelloides TaxID=1746091 RepID=A0AAV7YXY0_9EUKA|nr:solute carrier family 35 member b1 [Anaeramoeba flamelloides]